MPVFEPTAVLAAGDHKTVFFNCQPTPLLAKPQAVKLETDAKNDANDRDDSADGRIPARNQRDDHSNYHHRPAGKPLLAAPRRCFSANQDRSGQSLRDNSGTQRFKNFIRVSVARQRVDATDLKHQSEAPAGARANDASSMALRVGVIDGLSAVLGHELDKHQLGPAEKPQPRGGAALHA